MIDLDKDCFIVENELGVADMSRNELFELLWRKFDSGKWYIIMFPMSGFTPVFKKIEETYYKPGSDKNKGFELSLPVDYATVLVLCYKEWMTVQQVQEIFNSFLHDEKIQIPFDRDVFFLDFQKEPPMQRMLRERLFYELNEYVKKRQIGT